MAGNRLRRLGSMALLVFMLALLTASPASAAFRGFEWGASRQEVLANETADLVEISEDNVQRAELSDLLYRMRLPADVNENRRAFKGREEFFLVYRTEILGLDTFLLYEFSTISDRLIGATYVFKISKANSAAVKVFKELLSEKYGEPLYADGEWGQTSGYDDVIWGTQDTKVSLGAFYADPIIRLAIAYDSPTYILQLHEERKEILELF